MDEYWGFGGVDIGGGEGRGLVVDRILGNVDFERVVGEVVVVVVVLVSIFIVSCGEVWSCLIVVVFLVLSFICGLFLLE